jgi:hypothetical protein
MEYKHRLAGHAIVDGLLFLANLEDSQDGFFFEVLARH